MAKMRIAYLIDTFSSDKAGTEKQLLNLIGRLDRERFEVTLVCLHASPWMQQNRLPCEVVDLRYSGFLKPGLPAVMGRYLRLLREKRFDVVQTFFEDAMIVGFLGKILGRTRHALVVSKRDLGLGSDELGYHRLFRKVRPLVYRGCDGLAVNAYAIKKCIVEEDGVSPEKITVIGNGIDRPAPPATLPSLFGEYRADVWIGIVANLKPVKRIDLLLRAVAHLRDLGVKEVVRTVILGEGRLRPELEQMARVLGIGDRVHFAGAVENVSDYLYGVDIGVLCSDKEGLSNAILEYMACGLPVIATDAGGNSEMVDEANGACVPVGDADALARALARLVGSTGLRGELGGASREKVRQNYSWETVLPKWKSYYASFAEGLAVGVTQSEKTHAET